MRREQKTVTPTLSLRTKGEGVESTCGTLCALSLLFMRERVGWGFLSWRTKIILALRIKSCCYSHRINSSRAAMRSTCCRPSPANRAASSALPSAASFHPAPRLPCESRCASARIAERVLHVASAVPVELVSGFHQQTGAGTLLMCGGRSISPQPADIVNGTVQRRRRWRITVRSSWWRPARS